MKYYVLHAVRGLGQKVHRTARLAVVDVPEKTGINTVAEALERAGRGSDFTEGGVAWGNHEIKSERSLPKDTADTDAVPEVNWDELQATKEVRRVTLRLQPQEYDAIKRAAARAKLPIQQWCVTTLNAASKED